MAAITNVWIGPAGFSYRDWEGPVYPTPHPRGFDPLSYLAERVDLVEINTTFYRMPERRMAEGWAKRVARFPRFRFTAKVHQSFTHGDEGTDWAAEDAAAFAEGIAPLADAGRLGAALLQFPWSLEADESARERLRRLLAVFAAALPAVPRIVELRHASWSHEGTARLLEEGDAGQAAVDQPRAAAELPLAPTLVGRTGYLRLHGRNSAAWFLRDAGRDEKYDWLYSSSELDEIEGIARRISAAADATYVVANNHFRGKAVFASLDLAARLGVRDPGPPLGAPPSTQPGLFHDG